jgi:dinuclear metal center YbgI/SA1388 family protein
MILCDLLDILHDIAPLAYAESWDNVGLLLGDPTQTVSRALLAIDYTDAVANEAGKIGCELVIAYHPPIFHPIKRLTAPDRLYDAARRGLAIYSPHTALDTAPGGTNDVLADVLGLENRLPLRIIEPKAKEYKLITFAPEEHAEKVAMALFEAGAGRIGHYTRCSFRTSGTGTFMGDDTTNPAVGSKCEYEKAGEIRIETVCPISRLAEIIKALRASHPYEEPAFDLLQLAAPPPSTSLGQGRIGDIPPASLDDIIAKIKRGLGLDRLLVAKAANSAPITKAACLAGAGREHIKDAICQKASLYLTGEIPHHDALAAAAAGVHVVCALHSNSERVTLAKLAQQLTAKAPSVNFTVSQADRDPFTIH